MNEAIREMFLTEWVETASKSEIVEKLIEHDERAKQIKQLKSTLEEIREAINKMVYQGYFDNNTQYFATSENSEFGTRAKVLLQIIDKGIQ